MDKNDIFEYVMNTPENTNPNVLRNMLNNLPSGGGSSLLVARAEISTQAFEEGGEIPLTLDKTYAQLAEAGVNSAIDLAVMMDAGSGEQQIGSIWCRPVFAEDMEVYDMQFIAYTDDISFMGMTAFVQVGYSDGQEVATLVLSETGSNSDIVKADLHIWLSQTGGVWTANQTFDDIKAKFNGSNSRVTLNVNGQLWSNGLYTHDDFFADTWYHNTNDPVLGGEVIRLTGSFVEDGHLVAVSIVAQNLNGTKTVTVDVDVRYSGNKPLIMNAVKEGGYYALFDNTGKQVYDAFTTGTTCIINMTISGVEYSYPIISMSKNGSTYTAYTQTVDVIYTSSGDNQPYYCTHT